MSELAIVIRDNERILRRLLNQASDLRERLRSNLANQQFVSDDLRMEQYN